MNALRPLTVGELLDSALRIYRERFKTLVAAVAIPVVPVVIFQTLVEWSAAPDGASANPFSAPESAETISGGEAALQLAGALVGLVAILLATALATAACFRVLSAAYVGGEVTWRESLGFARTRLGSVIGLNLLSTFGIVLGVVLCLVPGFLLFVWWAVPMPALLMEGLGVSDSLGRSRALVRQRFWPVAGALLLSMLVAAAFQIAIAAPFIGLLFTDVDGVVLYSVEAIVNLIGLVLVTPFTAAFTMALYVDLRVRFEGFDLYLWAQQEGRPVPAGVVPGHVAAQPGTFGPAGSPGGGGSLPPPPPPPSGFGPSSSLPPPPASPPDGP